MPAPVALFVYNRVQSLAETLKALAENEGAAETTVYVFSDGPKAAKEGDAAKVEAVRAFIREGKWPFRVELIAQETNRGLAESVIAGVTQVVEKHDRVIVLEDDLVIAKHFLKYMNEALERYKDEPEVMQVSGHQYPMGLEKTSTAFFLPLTTSWGWATWKRAWKHFDPLAAGYEELRTNRELLQRFNLGGTYTFSTMLFNQVEKRSVDSWAIRWWWTVFKKGGLVLFPDASLVQNIGYGSDATHTTTNTRPDAIDTDYRILHFPPVVADHAKMEQLIAFLKAKNPPKPSAASPDLFGRIKSLLTGRKK